MDNHNNRRQAPISPYRNQATKFYMDSNFYWYFAVYEVNENLARGNLHEVGNVGPNLKFWRHMDKQTIKDTIGMEPIYEARKHRT